MPCGSGASWTEARSFVKKFEFYMKIAEYGLFWNMSRW